MIEDFGVYIAITMALMVLFVASFTIPFVGYIRKRWKGLAIGCVMQPLFCVIVSLLTVLGIVFYQKYNLRNQRKDAMVVVKKTDNNENSVHFWYLKTNDECYYEYKEKENADNEYTGFDRGKRFDVVPLDSFRVEVDDKIVVKFDISNHKATATEHGEPIEIVSIDWDRVNDYFKNLPNYKNPGAE